MVRRYNVTGACVAESIFARSIIRYTPDTHRLSYPLRIYSLPRFDE